MTAVAVVIPSWNTAAYLDRCLDALTAQTGVPAEPFVVENGSVDGSLEILERRNVPHLALDSNVGFARAVNLGVAHTDSPFVLVLNADCFLDSDCVALLESALARDVGLGGVQPRIVQHGGALAGDPEGESSDDGVLIYSAGQCLTRRGAAFERGWGERDGPAFDQRAEVFGVSGAACLLRRELFTGVGGYDERYFAFYEDVDLNARARLAGWRFAYEPAARAHHVGHAAWSRQSRAQRFNVELTVRNRLATAVKTLPPAAVAGALALSARSAAAGPFRGSRGAAAAGVVTALRWLPGLLTERRRLRGAATHTLDDALVHAPTRGPDPRTAGLGRRL